MEGNDNNEDWCITCLIIITVILEIIVKMIVSLLLKIIINNSTSK